MSDCTNITFNSTNLMINDEKEFSDIKLLFNQIKTAHDNIDRAVPANTEKTKDFIKSEYTKYKGIINNRICLFNILKPYISINEDITNDNIIQGLKTGEILNEMVDQIRAGNFKLPENLSFIIPQIGSHNSKYIALYMKYKRLIQG